MIVILENASPRDLEGYVFSALADGLEEINRTDYSHYQDDPNGFVRDVLGHRHWSKQDEILDSVRDNRETVVKACHGSSKTFTAAEAAVWWLNVFTPSIVITTAPTGRQVKKLLWQEINKNYSTAGDNLKGRCLETEIKISPKHYAYGFTARDADDVQGPHSEHILVIIDEASGVSQPIRDGLDGSLTGGHARLLVIGNPISATGPFFNDFQAGQGNKITISAFDTPNFTHFGITEDDIDSGEWEDKLDEPLPWPQLVDPDWVADKYRKWGKDSPLYQGRVLGEFPSQAVDTVIPYEWAHQARTRNEELEAGEPLTIGVDVARFGDDNSVIYVRAGPKALSLDIFNGLRTDQLAGRVKDKHREHDARTINIDSGAMGPGVIDPLVAAELPVEEIAFGSSPLDEEQYADRAAEMWFNMRELLDPSGEQPIGLPDNDDLVAQLTSRKYSYLSSGKKKLERKSEMKSRGAGSPDEADAAVLAYAPVKPKPSGSIFGVGKRKSYWR